MEPERQQRSPVEFRRAEFPPASAAQRVLRRLPPLEERNPFLRWGVALFALCVVAVITVTFPANTRPYYLFVVGVAVATWYGGMLPGLAATILSVLLGWRFVSQPEVAGGWNVWEIGIFAGFAAVCLLVFGLTSAVNRATAQLRAAHLRASGLIRLSEDAIVTIDEDHNISLFNEGAEKIFGYRAPEILGKPVHLLVPEKFRDLHEQYVDAFMKSQDALRPMGERGTIHGRRADGSEFPAAASISKFSAGDETIMTVRLRDLSERYAADQRLRQMAAIVEFSQDAIISSDLKGTIVSWNPAAEKLYGYSAEEAIGKDARMLIPPGGSDEVSDRIERARRGVSSTEETTRRRKDGTLVTVAVTVSPIYEMNGQVAGVVTVVRDITERKQWEAQLLHAQKMEAVGRLAGAMAHDFNNLLSIIIGYAFLIQSGAHDEESLRHASAEIMSTSEKASALTRQLLAFSRKQAMHPEVVDLNAVTAGLARILPRLLGPHIQVHTAAGEQLHRVKVDPGQVEQVVMNLAMNAGDAMPTGGRLTIETANVYFAEGEARAHGVKPGKYAMLAVGDTGLGMDENTRSHLFEPFFTTKAAGKGTGLGLATVYGVVSQCGGHIRVFSEPGQGSTFKIYFPATRESVAAVGPPKPAPVLCGSETLLLVEDEPNLRELMAQVLRDRGYRLLIASNGREALQIAGGMQERLDLLLTDLIMPEIRGHLLAQTLAQTHAGMAVILMSGYPEAALSHSGDLPAGTAFLQKPFSPDFLLRRVRELLDKTADHRRARREAV